jgi:hypothetical protein
VTNRDREREREMFDKRLKITRSMIAFFGNNKNTNFVSPQKMRSFFIRNKWRDQVNE